MMKALVICAIRGEVLCLCAGMHCTLILVSAPALNGRDKDGGGKKTRGSGDSDGWADGGMHVWVTSAAKE